MNLLSPKVIPFRFLGVKELRSVHVIPSGEENILLYPLPLSPTATKILFP
jgi:hypothetical protein